MVDPYVYSGADVLINRLGIRDAETLRRFEVEATAQRLSEGLPRVDLDARGYCELHHHIFQDVYVWAGRIRTVDISKGGHLFCRPAFIDSALSARFAAIDVLPDPEAFAKAMAEHLSELNAIHPFREGNGRTNRALLKLAGTLGGHLLDLARIDPAAWNSASRESFHTGATDSFRRIIADCLCARR